MLALIGWYLMAPPLKWGPLRLDSEAPLSSWGIIESFDTAKQCEAFRMRRLEEINPSDTGSFPKNMKQAAAAEVFFSQCIASDDPRLKRK